MSYTEIYKITPKGNVKPYAEIKNAWRGAVAIWDILDNKYLPPYLPEWSKLDNPRKDRYHRMGDSTLQAMKEVWALATDSRLTRIDHICLRSTFDKVIVLKENFTELIKAFREFEGETSLKEQADVIELLFNQKGAIGIAWNQTSVSEGCWRRYGSKPYNINTNTDHWNLFEDLNNFYAAQ